MTRTLLGAGGARAIRVVSTRNENITTLVDLTHAPLRRVRNRGALSAIIMLIALGSAASLALAQEPAEPAPSPPVSATGDSGQAGGKPQKLPEIEVISAEKKVPSKSIKKVAKTTSKPQAAPKSQVAKKAPSPAPVPGPPPEATGNDSSASTGGSAAVGSASGSGPISGTPGTGTTGIDGYVAKGTSTATKTNTPIKDIPQAISVVTKEQAEDRGSETVGEALTYVPGVAVAQGEGHRDQISIRGQVTTADFYIDGTRDDAEYYRDLYNVQAIEVLKGPAAMVFGRGGGGGVVNRVTKKADGARVREVTVNAGMYDRKRTTIDVGDNIGSAAAFRLNAMYEDSENFRDFFELERYGINPTAAFKLSDQTKISLSYEYYKDGRTVDRGVPSFAGRPSRGPIEAFFGNPNVNVAEFQGQAVTATVEHRTDFGLNIRNHSAYADYDKVYDNTFATSPVSATGNVRIEGYSDATLRENFINQTDLTYRWDMGNQIRHTFAAGTEFVRQETDNSRDVARFGNPAGPGFINVPFANPTTSVPVFYNNINRRRHTELETASVYFQDQLEITRYLEVIGGLRFDRFDVAFVNGINGVRLDRIDEVWSPRIGVVFKPLETLSLYISSSESFLPGAGDQFNNLTTVSGATLEPEGFENREIGFKWEVAPRLFFTGAIFTLDRTNQIITSGPFNGEQVGLTRTEGGELSLTGYVTDAWQVSAGWGHQIAQVEQGNPANIGKEVPFVPHNVYSLWNRYQFLPMWGVGLGVIHQTESFAELNNLVELPEFTRVDAALYFNPSENWSAQINVENVLDEEYFASAHNNNNISPGAPRSAYVTVKARF